MFARNRYSSLVLHVGLMIVFCLAQNSSVAQKRYSYNSQIWLSYFNNLRLSENWGISLDGSIRTQDHMVNDFSQLLFRAGGTWYISEDLRATVGYVYSEYYPNPNHPYTKRIEHRPYEMIQWVKNAGAFRFVQTGRLEQRFRQRILNGDLGEGYGFLQRARLASVVMWSLSRHGFTPKHFAITSGLELFYNIGKEVRNNGFDQLRASANIQYQISKTNTITGGYLYQVQQFNNGDGYNKLNAIRFSFIQQLDLRKIKS
jgi:hypothetical protein